MEQSTKFLDKQELRFYPTRVEQPRNNLEQGVYQVIIPERSPPHYLYVGELTMPDEVYGDAFDQVDRILETFGKTERNIGVYFAGLKGTGKTLTARILALRSGLPVIRCQHALSEAELSFIQDNYDLTGPCVIFLDEFDKLYNLGRDGNSNSKDPTEMSRLLSFMDGAGSSKFLFILTSNNLNMPEFLTNRMGRIRYVQTFDGLSAKLIEQYVDNKLENKDHRESVETFVARFPNITFDILVNLVDEMNMYNETAQNAIKMLNVRTENAYYTGDLTLFGVKIGYVNGDIEPGDWIERLVDEYEDELSITLNLSYDVTRKLAGICKNAGVEFDTFVERAVQEVYPEEKMADLRAKLRDKVRTGMNNLDKHIPHQYLFQALFGVLHTEGKISNDPTSLVDRLINNHYTLNMVDEEWTRSLQKRGKKLVAVAAHADCEMFKVEMSPSTFGSGRKFAF